MDAPTILSLSAACGYAVPDALVEEMRQRELERMRRHDVESYVAQTHYTHNLQVTPRIRPQTWYSLFLRAWNLLLEIQDLVLGAMIRLHRNQIEPLRLLLIEVDRRAGSVWANNDQYGEEVAEDDSEDDAV